MDSLSTPVVSAAKLSILNPNEFDLWKMRIKQYFLMTDYSLWEVIINEDSSEPTVVIDGVVRPVNILSADQKLARRNELKAYGTLLIALPDKHQLKFNSHKDGKTLIFENLDQIHDRLQKLVSQLEIHEVSLSKEDVNLKFLRSLPSEWKTHTLIWRNKADLEEHSLDEFFNSLRIYEAKVKHSSTPGNPTQNLAFVSSSNTDSTTDSVSTATSVSAVCAQLSVSSHPNIDFLSNAVIFSFFASQSTSPRLDNEDLKQIDVDDLEEMDLSWQMDMLTMRARREDRSPKDTRRSGAAEPQRRHVPFETSTSNALVSHYDGIGSYDWSYQAEEEPANFAPMAITSSSYSSDNEVSDSDDESKPNDPQSAPSFVQTSEHVKPSRHSVQPVEAPILAATPKPTSPKTNYSGKRKNRKTCFMCMSVDHLIKDCNFHAKPKTQPTLRNYAHRGYNKQHASFTKKYPQKHIVPAAVLTKSKPVSITAVRPISAAVPKIMVTRPRHAHSLNTKYNSTIRRHKTHSQSLKTSNSSLKVTAAKASVVSAARGKKGKWGNPQYALKDKGVIDSNPKGGKISGKGKIKAGNLVRGLPTKVFKNNNTCVASKKGKQHRASCKTKPVSSVNQPLFRLHMDLFGPTFVKSLNKKSYCLVITDDYSRFTWVFLLATKDETSPILKTFITGLENQLSLKVKVIRSDNGTEFKNSDLNQFYSLLPIPFWAEAVNTACYVQNRVIPSEDPYEEAAQQLFEQEPHSPEYVPRDHVPVFVPEFEHPENLVPAEDEAPASLLPPGFLSPRTPPLLPIPLSTPSTIRRAGIPEADTPPRNRPLLATPRPWCEVGESSA
nr:hypothetical protein [Tanacetum cinerariifolium]